MLPEYFAVIGAVIASIGGFVYLYETIRGTAQPNRVTWLLWFLLPMIAFVAQRVQGVGAVSWVTFASGFTPLLVVVASFFNKKAYWKTVPVDYACMVIAFVGITLWGVTKNPNIAIVFSIAADFAAGFPTLKKSYTHPQTESWTAYAISAAGFTLSMLAIHTWTFANYGFVLYLTLMNAALAVLAFRGRKQASSVRV